MHVELINTIQRMNLVAVLWGRKKGQLEEEGRNQREEGNNFIHLDRLGRQ